MKKLLLAALLLTSTSALAQTTTAGGAPAVQAGPADNHEKREEKFAEHKAKILERINQHLAEVQKHQACVQAANNREARAACFPTRGKGRGERVEGGHEGRERQ